MENNSACEIVKKRWGEKGELILLENELGTFALVKVASMQWGTLVKT